MWYAARLLVKCVVGERQESDFLFDEQVRLIKADGPEQAYDKAISLGNQEIVNYKNEQGETVKWSFEGLFDLQEIDTLEDGSEITSKRFRASGAEQLVFPKEKLSVFFEEGLGNKTADEILGYDEK